MNKWIPAIMFLYHLQTVLLPKLETFLRCFCDFRKLNIHSGFGACVLSHFSHVWPFVTLWTVAHQAPLSMGFSRQEYWSGLPCPPPGNFPNPGIEPTSPASPAWAGSFFTTSTIWEALVGIGWEYYSAKKEQNDGICSNLNATRDHHTK